MIDTEKEDDGFEADDIEEGTLLSVQTELQTLYEMRKIVIGKATLEYPVMTAQYVLKKNK